MNNIKRLMAAAIAGVLIISAAACSDSSANEYPVKIAGHTFDAKPESVVCLSDSVADKIKCVVFHSIYPLQII